MELESFRVTNFRSISDSGPVEVRKITALLGRNESGKSNLLLALRTLNPVDGFKALNPTKDFPRHRRLTECKDSTPVVESVWKLSEPERAALSAIIPRAEGVTNVVVGRFYAAERWVDIPLPPIEFDRKKIRLHVSKLAAAIEALADKQEDGPKTALLAASPVFASACNVADEDLQDWAAKSKPAINTLRKLLASHSLNLTEGQDAELQELKELAELIEGNQSLEQRAKQYIEKQLPLFIYLADYPELNGRQHILSYLERKGAPTPGDMDFEKLCKVAGLDPVKLQQLNAENKTEERNQLANRSSAIVTKELKDLWKDRALKVRFNLDGNYLETMISDPNHTYDVEVNLDERSRGFRWFFSFYITFAADTDGGKAKGAILLLDEPGLYLHIQSQKDLLIHFERDFDNQILYTTHSPFMVPVQTLDWLRTVNIAEEGGTTVTNNPTGDMRTLAPIRAALGYHYIDSLYIQANNLIVEGVTDSWIIEAVSSRLKSMGKAGLPNDLAICPVDGASKAPPMVSLLLAQKLNVLVLLDDEPTALQVKDEMVKSKLIQDRNVFLVSDVIEQAPSEMDIEDLLDPNIYEALIYKSYSTELKGKSLNPNNHIPRIVKRFEQAFEAVGLPFHKTRVAGLFFRTMSTDPTSVISQAELAHFEKLFALISKRLQKTVGNTK